MQTSNTALFFLEDDCIRAFGQETGCTLLQQAEELYQDLCQHGNDRGNHVIEEHIQSRLFPLMSYYKALLKHGIQEDQALLLVRETAHKAAIDKKAEASFCLSHFPDGRQTTHEKPLSSGGMADRVGAL